MFGKSLKNLMALIDTSENHFSLLEDPFNLKKERSEKNCSVLAYNCGGYALGTFNWFIPLFVGETFYTFWLKDLCKIKNWSMEEDDCDNISQKYPVNSNEFYLKCKNSVISLLVQEIKNNCLTFLGEDSSSDIAGQLFDCADFSDPAMLAAAVKMMLKAFPDMRKIDDLKEIHEDEYGVIYAAREKDFHFVKYDNGIFSHKMGDDDIRIVKDIDDALYANGYTSKYFFFAKKR